MLWAETFGVERPSTVHRHDLEELVLCLEGRCRQCSPGHEDLLQPGDLCFLPAGLRHHLLVVDAPLQVGVACFDRRHFGLRLQGLIDGLRRRGHVYVGGGNWLRDFARERWAALMAEVRRGLVYAEERVSGYVAELLIECHRSVEGAEVEPDDERRSAVAGLLEAIARQPDQLWSIDACAHRLGCSRASFTRHFRAVTGSSLVEHLHALRLEEAARQLKYQPGLGLAQIALRAGFGNLSHFHRLFRARFGVSPQRFRARVASDGVFPQFLQEIPVS